MSKNKTCQYYQREQTNFLNVQGVPTNQFKQHQQNLIGKMGK